MRFPGELGVGIGARARVMIPSGIRRSEGISTLCRWRKEESHVGFSCGRLGSGRACSSEECRRLREWNEDRTSLVRCADYSAVTYAIAVYIVALLEIHYCEDIIECQ